MTQITNNWGSQATLFLSIRMTLHDVLAFQNLPLVQLEDLHAEQSHDQTGHSNNDNPNHHREMATRDYGKNLATDNTVHHAVSNIGENV
jgi:hypothetical protein